MGSIFRAPKIPDPAPIEMPKVEDVPEAEDPAVLAAEAEAQRKRDRNRKGRRSTILTGTGLNEIEDANIDQKNFTRIIIMGGPTKSTGSNTSDERKTSTKKYFEKKKAAKKSNYKTTKFGFKVKKNIAEQYVDKNPVFSVVGNLKDQHNLTRRMKFADKKGIDMKNMSTEQILSKDFKKTLDAQGYTRKDVRTGKDEGGDTKHLTQKSIEQPKVKSQMSNTDVKSDMITAEAPSVTEMTADEIALKNKRKGRKKTILTSVTGVDDYPTLSKKTLLG